MNVFIVCFLSIFVVTINAQFDKSSCCHTKGCLFNPPNCSAPGVDCMSAVSYKSSGNYTTVELMRALNGTSMQYVAVGYSKDGIKMGDDMVAACVNDGAHPQVYLSYNMVNLSDCDNVTHHCYHASPRAPQQVTYANIRNVHSSVKNGMLYCSFDQMINPTMNDGGKVFTLNASYTLLLAMGGATADGIGYHFKDKIGSNCTINVTKQMCCGAN